MRQENEKFTHLSIDVSVTGETSVLSFSLFTGAPVVAGADVDCPAGISSGSSGQPNASLVFP